MPTGYTAGILDGETTTFEQFAINCMRAFGATIHMRDEPNDKKYEPRTPNEHHSKEIAEAKKEIERINSLSDSEIVNECKQSSNDEIARLMEIIESNNQNKVKLESILTDVNSWQIPSTEHQGIKDFMIQQLEVTIKHDGDSIYYQDKIEESKRNQKFINAQDWRKTMLESAEWSLNYHTKEHKAEIERCESSNKWVKDLLGSLNGSNT